MIFITSGPDSLIIMLGHITATDSNCFNLGPVHALSSLTTETASLVIMLGNLIATTVSPLIIRRNQAAKLYNLTKMLNSLIIESLILS